MSAGEMQKNERLGLKLLLIGLMFWLMCGATQAGTFDVSGYIAPTYIYSQTQGISSFALGNKVSPFKYYSHNSVAGSIYLAKSYTFKDGANAQVAVIPNVSPDASFHLNTIILIIS